MPKEEEQVVVEELRFALLEKELEASLEKNRSLEKENEQLKQELIRLKAQIASLKAQDNDRKSALWKKLQTYSISDSNSSEQKPTKIQHNVHEESLAPLERSARIPKPPPPPSFASHTKSEVTNGKKPPAPPPPPPPPSKLHGYATAVRRVPEVVELYRSLTRRDSRPESRTGVSGTPPVAVNARNMIGEIENRSTYLTAIKSDVETQGEFIGFLTREVENAAYTEISDVEAFVRWLDGELSYLVDERAVLKHFSQWPERKADAMREAAFSYRDLKNLESEVSSFHDNPHQPFKIALKRIQEFQDKLERGIHNVERTRDIASKRYRELQIPWEWMLESGFIGQLKLCSMKLAKQYMKRVTAELIQSDAKDDLMLQAVRFVFRVHQFVGGFNAESMEAFKELTKAAKSCNSQCHNQHNILSIPNPTFETNTTT
ncbi:CHUP1-like protein [Tasmannia lanceolata]|uniref:CHUP1-like protein n=1 Tax=Tasmannia lanceolata TaxID=3420 RepID=UPI004064917B